MKPKYLLYAITLAAFVLAAYLSRPTQTETVRFHHTTYTDTIKSLELKYDTLYKIQRRTQTKYDTLYRVIYGDTSCHTTRELLTMHRQLDTLGY
jgi:hypothetical protein